MRTAIILRVSVHLHDIVALLTTATGEVYVSILGMLFLFHQRCFDASKYSSLIAIILCSACSCVWVVLRSSASAALAIVWVFLLVLSFLAVAILLSHWTFSWVRVAGIHCLSNMPSCSVCRSILGLVTTTWRWKNCCDCQHSVRVELDGQSCGIIWEKLKDNRLPQSSYMSLYFHGVLLMLCQFAIPVCVSEGSGTVCARMGTMPRSIAASYISFSRL